MNIKLLGENGSYFVSKFSVAKIWQFLVLIEVELYFLRSWENVWAFPGMILLNSFVFDLFDVYFVYCKKTHR